MQTSSQVPGYLTQSLTGENFEKGSVWIKEKYLIKNNHSLEKQIDIYDFSTREGRREGVRERWREGGRKEGGREGGMKEGRKEGGRKEGKKFLRTGIELNGELLPWEPWV
jgi:hypothetical protein